MIVDPPFFERAAKVGHYQLIMKNYGIKNDAFWIPALLFQTGLNFGIITALLLNNPFIFSINRVHNDFRMNSTCKRDTGYEPARNRMNFYK